MPKVNHHLEIHNLFLISAPLSYAKCTFMGAVISKARGFAPKVWESSSSSSSDAPPMEPCVLRGCRWQQYNAAFPPEPDSHNKRRKRKNDSFGSSSTALRDNIRIAFRLRVLHFNSPLIVPNGFREAGLLGARL